jgi:hypothetical protein
MTINEFIARCKDNFIFQERLVNIEISRDRRIEIYSSSIIEKDNMLFFIGREKLHKFLLVCPLQENVPLIDRLNGHLLDIPGGYSLKICPLLHENVQILQEIFSFTRPSLVGMRNSFGFGDRLGLANPGHLRALQDSTFVPVLAQQSIRELTRTGRTPDEVMDAAVWAILQEGYHDGFGADADHLKNPADIDLMVAAGFTMFTIDPGDHVDNEADDYHENELKRVVTNLPWEALSDNIENVERRYLNRRFTISSELILEPSTAQINQALAKYGKALAHIKRMFDHLKSSYPNHPAEVEVSVDETESVTSPFEHFFIAGELKRLGVEFISLAPRFIGRFEKGIDYRGDIDTFKSEFQKHLDITRYFGTYKISLHSGSDKFTVYRIIGSFKDAPVHIKTAGTSYLEALKVVATHEPDFFREILDFSRGLYEGEKKSYHVSADLKRVHSANNYTDSQLLELFHSDDARQVLHVTFGRVLTEKNQDGSSMFRDKIVNCLKEYEDTYDQYLIRHFKNHLEPFRNV